MVPPPAEPGRRIIVPAPRLDAPAPPASRAALPDGFGRRALIFVDTEEEFDWAGPRGRDGGTRAIPALAPLQARFAGHGFAPTYLLTDPVVADPAAVAMFAGWVEAGTAAVGAQLHAWVTPPHDEALTDANSFAGNLPEPLERAKLAGLTGRIAARFGRAPTVYRAGRYGVGPRTAALLVEQGYRLDTSVRAGFDYRPDGGPDFSRAGPHPFWAGPGGALLALPLSAGFIGPLRRHGGMLYRVAGEVRRVRGLLHRGGLLARVALTPEDQALGDAIALIRGLLDDGVTILSFSFHSPSLVPGNTPYVRDADDLARFHGWWDGMLAWLAREGIAPASAEELIAAARDARAA